MPTEIRESKAAQKELDRAPKAVLVSYETWARLIEEHGLAILRQYKGYHDEKLQGSWEGYRSSRLNLKWRVIYRVDGSSKIQIVNVVRVMAHDYRSKK